MSKFEIDLVQDHVDDSSVREIFADGVRVVTCMNGSVGVELTCRRPQMLKPLPAVPKIRTHTVARLALTMPAAAQLLENLRLNLAQNGIVPQAVSAPAETPKH